MHCKSSDTLNYSTPNPNGVHKGGNETLHPRIAKRYTGGMQATGYIIPVVCFIPVVCHPSSTSKRVL
jgi:hypothetical protein